MCSGELCARRNLQDEPISTTEESIQNSDWTQSIANSSANSTEVSQPDAPSD